MTDSAYRARINAIRAGLGLPPLAWVAPPEPPPLPSRWRRFWDLIGPQRKHAERMRRNWIP